MTMRGMRHWPTSSRSTSSTPALTPEPVPVSSLLLKAPKNSALRSTGQLPLPSSRRQKCGGGAPLLSFGRLDEKMGEPRLRQFALAVAPTNFRTYATWVRGTPRKRRAPRPCCPYAIELHAALLQGWVRHDPYCGMLEPSDQVGRHAFWHP